MIPVSINIKDNTLPDVPGVYLMKDATGKVIYVGKASSLKRRVASYFLRPQDSKTQELVQHIASIDYIEKSTAIEALILEANLIKLYWPIYNVKEKDDRSFLYLVFTNEPFPKPLLVRGSELRDQGDPESFRDDKTKTTYRNDKKKYKAVFGPYTSPHSLRAALDFLRRVFPWSTCEPGQKRACFYVHLGLCPGVCINAIDQKTYGKIIRDLGRFFSGKKESLIRQYEREMRQAAKEQRFELAKDLRDKIAFLGHIQDIAILKREDEHLDKIKTGEADVRVMGRIEGYDISNISGTNAVASMVVFEQGQVKKSAYRKFRIKTVQGPNDVASIRETLMRRFRHPEWPHPDLLLIDGGLPQVHAAERVLRHFDLSIPIVGMVKGPDRKRTDLICSEQHLPLCQACEEYIELLIRVRDEAHRFAITYHRKLRRSAIMSP